MNASRTIVGILVGGGPAPGINSVISAVTIRSILGGCDVVGILDGFKWLMEGSASQVRPLSIEEVSRIHFRGGSYLGTSRANPTKKAESLANVLSSLMRLGITRLVTIGGDDTAFSSLKLEEQAAGRIHIVHVPKTIDNDLDLPSWHSDVRLSNGPACRRRDRQESHGGRPHHVALVLCRDHGAQSRPFGARNRQGRRRHAHRHSRGI